MTALEDALPGLLGHRDRIAPVSMREMFRGDSGRFERFTARSGGLLLDYSKNRLDADALAALVRLAEAAGVPERRAAMFGGEAINGTENRAVLHTALRAGPDAVATVSGEDVMPGIRAELDRMLAYAEAVRTGAIGGVSGGFTDVVNIGIGGSDLGPAMATRALRPYWAGPRVHFVSNVDGAHIADTLRGLEPGTTLFLVASKTFTTTETMTNAATARRWVADALGEAAVGRHFAAMSTAQKRMADFGIERARAFGFGDFVGGRYSLWSTIGLPLAIAIGADGFRALLRGANEMDRHFVDAPLGHNLPVLMALLGIWHRNVWGYAAHAVLPYDQRLDRFAAYLQQLDMESNGKRVTTDGSVVRWATGPVVFGEPGTNGQHAFYQLIHQGTDVIPTDFLVAAEGQDDLPEHHAQLLASCLAQSEALMWGKTLAEAEAELIAAGMAPEAIAKLAPHKVFPGNRPSSTLLYPRLDPAMLGQLIALYEHRVFVEGVIWNINSFDQWGVELGKQLAAGLVGAVQTGDPPEERDGSTKALIRAAAAMRAR
ncbi:MAG: glucose-6-phosphate isomerase [Bauldia sp.]|nr:glucose-6-phosphate isomerase [Bauldia sp.]